MVYQISFQKLMKIFFKCLVQAHASSYDKHANALATKASNIDVSDEAMVQRMNLSSNSLVDVKTWHSSIIQSLINQLQLMS